MVLKDEAKSHRKAIYFDLICGTICSITALTGIIFVSITQTITNMSNWVTGLTFWILYLIFSLLLIGYGLFTKWREKRFENYVPKKDLKAPIV
ncbi:MAG: hypothetical protein ACXAAH_11715 [Promethearchaeota archaeon]|jgi:ABC-type nickel/cobalt efflux system permease component RcnA